MRSMSPLISVIEIILTVSLLLVSGVTVVDAATCTSNQETQALDVIIQFNTSPDCSGSTGTTLDSTKPMTENCATACMDFMRELALVAPDCEYDGLNTGESLGLLVQLCDQIQDSKPSFNVSSGSGLGGVAANSTNMTGPVETCTDADIDIINELNAEAETNADCLGSGGVGDYGISIATFCAEDPCIAFVTALESRVPNCTVNGENIKQVLADSVAPCNDPTATWAPITTNPTATRSTPTTQPTEATPIPTETASQPTSTPTAPISMTNSLKPAASITTAMALTLTIILQ